MADKIKISRRRDYREQLRLYLNYTKRLNAKLKKLFNKVSIQASRKYLAGFDIENIFSEEYGNELYSILSNQYTFVIEQTANRINRQRFRKEMQTTEQIVASYVSVYTAKEVTNISETTRKKIANTIRKGLRDGLSIQQISKNIKNSSAFASSRATLIARTETHNAMNVGNLEIAKSLELKNPKKEWNNALDTRARSWHKRMDGKRVGIDEKFIVNTPTKNGVIPIAMSSPGDTAGGPMNVCNCRCFLTFYDEEDDVIS